MKIITKCALPQDKIYDVVCKICHSTIEYTGKDGKFHSGAVRYPPFFTFECPVCKYTNSIDLTRGREPSTIPQEQDSFDKRQV
jgi:hypothetical protein